MDALIQASQLILSLSILIVLHELGHFIPAKLFKTRVEKFYLFFDPWFSLFKTKRGETEYGIGWLPLGGYVKIAGMIDESMDKEQLKQEPQPWEFRSKPAWQRLIIMIGGVTVNVILGIFIYTMILMTWGEEYLPTENVKYGIMADSIALEMGLQNGDKILQVDGKYVDNFMKIPAEIIVNQAKTITVERNGEVLTIPVSEEMIAKMIKSPNFISPRFPFIADRFTDDSAGKKAGIEKGDKLISINGKEFPFFDAFKNELSKHKNEEITIGLERNGSFLELTLTVPESGLLGIYPDGNLSSFFELKKIEYSFFEAIPAGFKKAYDTFDNYIKQLKLLFSPKVKGYESLGGFITIGKAFDTEWNWPRFWSFTAFLSIVLAIMNILPIPALDGGHVMFLLYEVITGRKPNEKVMEYAQYAGMILLLSLLLFANGSDIVRLFK
jgi:regulator of sigma E protease